MGHSFPVHMKKLKIQSMWNSIEQETICGNRHHFNDKQLLGECGGRGFTVRNRQGFYSV